jgi:hypothetical protein
MSSQPSSGGPGGGGGQGGGGRSKPTKQDILDALRKEGITDLDTLANRVVSGVGAGASSGSGAVANSTVCGNWFCVTP